MNYNDFKEVVTELYELKLDSDKYLDSVPSDIREVVYDNRYIDNHYRMFDVTIKALLKDLYYDFSWFLYELSDSVKSYPNKDNPNITCTNGNQYWIHNLETYLEYAKIELFDNGLKDTV